MDGSRHGRDVKLPRGAVSSENALPCSYSVESLGTLVPLIQSVIPNFMDCKNPAFTRRFGMPWTTFVVLYDLKALVLIANILHILTKEEESLLWESGVLGLETPKALF